MTPIYPSALLTTPGNDAGLFVSGPRRGVLHTTEGPSAGGAVAAYKANNSWPHFTVARDGLVFQHIRIDRAARALKNMKGGVETNRQGAIQIEVVGYARATDWPLPQVEALRKLMRWIEAEADILPEGPAFGSSEQYGLKNPFEFTYVDWQHFNGWCGHQHVPENSHWDPGAIDLNTLLPEVPVIQSNAPIVGIAITPSGQGYIIVAADGGTFAYGDAPYIDHPVYTLPAGYSWVPKA